MKLQLGSKASDIFILVYLTLSLLLRFFLEPQLQGNAFISIALGGLALLFLWALIKSKLLNPTYFGLLGDRENNV